LRTACAAALAVAAGIGAPALTASASTAAPKTLSCSTLTVKLPHGGSGRTSLIRATGTSCRRAYVVVRSCMRDSLHGWRITTAPSADDRRPHGLIGLDRGAAHISFEVRGRGGCA
jgi:hypothetical protein